jgi:aspartokinase/homoserine dehydrogenase 1
MANMNNVAQIVFKQNIPIAVVVSAVAGVTDSLCKALELAKRRDPLYTQTVQQLVQLHSDLAEQLLCTQNDKRMEFVQTINQDAEDINTILKTVALGMAYSMDIAELVTGYGELWSSLLLTALLSTSGMNNKVARMDARQVLTLLEPDNPDLENSNAGSLQSKNSFSAAFSTIQVDWETSKKKLLSWINQQENKLDCIVITGYICSKFNGSPGTLKRNGSDFSASIFGALFKSRMVHIWTDVDGVYSADPRTVPSAIKITRMSYEVASELAYFGGKVLHPSTMAPVMSHSIPVSIRSSLNHDDPGTTILNALLLQSTDQSTCFSSISNLVLLYIDCSCSLGMGLVDSVSAALKSVRVPIVLVTQASFEHCYRFCVHEEDVKKAQVVLEKALYRELHIGLVKGIRVSVSCSLVAAIGEGLVTGRGNASRIFVSLDGAGIEVMLLNQGSASRSISVLVKSSDTSRAIQSLHGAFYSGTSCC